MSIPLLLCLVSIKFLLFLHLIHCAPKIGGLMFEPILFEAFESDEKTTIPTGKETTLSKSTVATTLIDVITGTSKETVTKLDTISFNVDMEYLEDETVIKSTSTSTVEETTAFITELNIETESTPINTSLTFNNTSVDQNTTTVTTPATKKVMLHELLTPDKLKRYVRARDESTTNNVILNFMGYNFDDAICRIVDDRVLCGYNSNPQQAQPVQTVEVGNGCQLRGDRIECGYVNPPFDGMRRPPIRPGGNRSLQEELSDKLSKETTKDSPALTFTDFTTKPTTTTTELTTITTTKATSRDITTSKAISINPSSTIVSPSTTTVTVSSTERTTVKRQEYCVEKGDRIVCYDIKN